MTNKVIDLFNKDGSGDKISELLVAFVEPFIDRFPDKVGLDYIYEVSISAWNIACLSSTVPKGERDSVLQLAYNDFPNEPLLEPLIKRKFEVFGKYDHIYLDFQLEEDDDGELMLSVDYQSMQDYLAGAEEMNDNVIHAMLRSGPIDRYAIVLKPKKPLVDWINDLYPDEPINEVDEANIYLVNRDRINDWDSWLKKRFDRFFQLELEEWHADKKEWPQKRNYKMFTEWFEISFSSFVMDMENTPIAKGEI